MSAAKLATGAASKLAGLNISKLLKFGHTPRPSDLYFPGGEQSETQNATVRRRPTQCDATQHRKR
jgi:hypothetical protein